MFWCNVIVLEFSASQLFLCQCNQQPHYRSFSPQIPCKFPPNYIHELGLQILKLTGTSRQPLGSAGISQTRTREDFLELVQPPLPIGLNSGKLWPVGIIGTWVNHEFMVQTRGGIPRCKGNFGTLGNLAVRPQGHARQ